jgi:predicted nucleic acid-binding protein
MEKKKIYLDTSVISHLDQPEKVVEQEYSLKLWNYILEGSFEVFLSGVVFEEIRKCKNIEKSDRLLDFIEQINYLQVPLTYNVVSIAELIIKEKILPRSSYNDCRHIAAAISMDCDFLLSWNLKHLANYTTNDNVRNIITHDKYHKLSIISPKTLLEKECVENDEIRFTTA